MKALVLRAPGEFFVEEVATPACGDDELLVRMHTVAVCGSDPPLLLGKSLPDSLPSGFPHIPGHEGAGVIARCGKNVVGFSEGDRVVVESHCGCGWCENCKSGRYNLCLNFGRSETGHRQYGFTAPGCFAEYCTVRPQAVHRIPEGLTFDHGALTDTVATALHALDGLHVVPGNWILVLGCGPIGLSAVMLCKAMGCRVIALERGPRRSAAKACGADKIMDFTLTDLKETVYTVTGGVGADLCLDCAGTAASLQTALELCRRGGSVGVIPIPASGLAEIDVKSLVWDEKTVRGFRGNPNCHDRVLSLMAEKAICAEKLITHRFPLDAFQEAFDKMISRDPSVIKILIDIP